MSKRSICTYHIIILMTLQTLSKHCLLSFYYGNRVYNDEVCVINKEVFDMKVSPCYKTFAIKMKEDQ